MPSLSTRPENTSAKPSKKPASHEPTDVNTKPHTPEKEKAGVDAATTTTSKNPANTETTPNKPFDSVSTQKKAVSPHVKPRGKAMTTAAAPVSTRRRKKAPLKLSAVERQRLQRLQLLQLARQSASVAAALLLSDKGQPRPTASLTGTLEKQITERKAAAAATAAAVDAEGGIGVNLHATERGGASMHALNAAGVIEKGSGNAALKMSRSKWEEEEAVSGSLASAKAVRRVASTDTAAPQLNKNDGSGFTKGSANTQRTTNALPSSPPSALPYGTTVPSSYTQLWRELLLMQFVQSDNGDAKSGNTAVTLRPASAAKAKSTQKSAAVAPVLSVAKTLPSSTRPPSVLSSLADEFQALDAQWRRFFLGSSAEGCGSGCEGISTMRSVTCPSTLLDQAYASRLTCGEQYTMRRYDALFQRNCMQMEQTEETEADKTATPSSFTSFVLHGELEDAPFFMDYF